MIRFNFKYLKTVSNELYIVVLPIFFYLAEYICSVNKNTENFFARGTFEDAELHCYLNKFV